MNHSLLQVGGAGLRRFNPWTITEEDRKSATKIFDKFDEQNILARKWIKLWTISPIDVNCRLCVVDFPTKMLHRG